MKRILLITLLLLPVRAFAGTTHKALVLADVTGVTADATTSEVCIPKDAKHLLFTYDYKLNSGTSSAEITLLNSRLESMPTQKALVLATGVTASESKSVSIPNDWQHLNKCFQVDYVLGGSSPNVDLKVTVEYGLY